MQRLLILFLIHLSMLEACTDSPAIEPTIQHRWQDTRRGTPKAGRYANCSNDGSVENSQGDLKRLLTLLHRIAAANSTVFTGALSVEQMCLELDLKSEKPDAHSDPDSKRLTFTRALVSVAQTDDELAAVLSHELAHITLQHQGFGETPARATDDPQFSALNAEALAVQREITRLARNDGDSETILALTRRYGHIKDEMNRIIDLIYGEPNAHRNWFEQEADDVGSEFFIKAGFDEGAFISMLWKFSKDSKADNARCQSLIDAALVNGPSLRPDRGSQIHPSVCWRVYHLLVDEWKTHMPYFDSF